MRIATPDQATIRSQNDWLVFFESKSRGRCYLSSERRDIAVQRVDVASWLFGIRDPRVEPNCRCIKHESGRYAACDVRSEQRGDVALPPVNHDEALATNRVRQQVPAVRGRSGRAFSDDLAELFPALDEPGFGPALPLEVDDAEDRLVQVDESSRPLNRIAASS